MLVFSWVLIEMLQSSLLANGKNCQISGVVVDSTRHFFEGTHKMNFLKAISFYHREMIAEKAGSGGGGGGQAGFNALPS